MKSNTTDNVVTSVILENADLTTLGRDEDFFDAGISSLTVVSMQLEIETRLNCNVPTKELMKTSTINGWSAAYAAAANS